MLSNGYENIVFEVKDIDRSSMTVHQIVTVMNEKGKKALHFAEYTDKYRILEDAEVKVFDAMRPANHPVQTKRYDDTGQLQRHLSMTVRSLR